MERRNCSATSLLLLLLLPLGGSELGTSQNVFTKNPLSSPDDSQTREKYTSDDLRTTEGLGPTDDYTTESLVTSEDYTSDDPGTTKDYTTADPGTTEDYTTANPGTTKHYTTKHPDTRSEGTDPVTSVKPTGLLTPSESTSFPWLTAQWQLRSLLDLASLCQF
ncbi:hypothetical protein GH733_016614 [Mirounga leonina]|nr:hypothetical protein GH733_016614 [Mirounga leonina]